MDASGMDKSRKFLQAMGVCIGYLRYIDNKT